MRRTSKSCVTSHLIRGVVFLLFLRGASAAEESGNGVASIYRVANNRQKQIQSVTAKYHGVMRKLANAPSVASNYESQYDILFRTDGRKAYSSVLDSRIALPGAQADPHPDEPTVSAFDGLYCIEVKGKTAILARQIRNSLYAFEHYCRHALYIPYTETDQARYDNGWFYPHVLRPTPDKKVRYTLSTAMEKVGGADCLVLEYPGYDKLWVDMAHNGALRKRQRFTKQADNDVWLSTEDVFDDFREAAPGLAVPYKCTFTFFGRPGDPPQWRSRAVFETVLNVDSVELNRVTDSDFRPTLSPGTLLITEDNQSVVTGDWTTERLDELAKLLPKPPKSRLWQVITWLSVALAISSCLFWLLVHRRKNPRNI